jgi:hypothetical protein
VILATRKKVAKDISRTTSDGRHPRCHQAIRAI